jgi:hypothetical protein
MKNENMVRTIDYGKKHLYFMDCKVCARFVNLYKDLFIADWFRVSELVTTRGKVWELEFMIRHQDMYDIRKVLKTVKKSFEVKDNYHYKSFRYTREFKEA